MAITAESAPKRRGTNNPAPKISLEDLPSMPVDTVDTADPETKIIVYSNNTWRYYRPNLPQQYDHLPEYTQHWDTTQVFAYRGIEISDLPDNIEMKLINSLDEFHSPIVGRISSPFGTRGRRNHNGVDIPLRVGEPIYAAFDGKVRYAKFNNGGFGNLVIVRHPNGLETWHAHLSKLNVHPNDYVKSGQIIGFGGNTGRSYGAHLHFEVRYKDQNFDPQFLFDFPEGQLKYMTFALDRSYLNIHSRATDQLVEDEDFDPTTVVFASGDQDGETILERIERAERDGDKIATAAAAPKPAVAPTKVYHTVRSGDTLGGIAIRHKSTVTKICQLNGISRTTKLQIGKKLRVK